MAELRPMALGEIIDRAATVWRRHWATLFKLFLGFELLQYVVLKTFQLLQSRYFPLTRGGARAMQAITDRPDEALRQFAVAGASGAFSFAVVLFVSTLAGVAATRYLAPAFIGEAPSLDAALSHTRQRAPLTLTSFLTIVGWAVLVGLVFHLPGVAFLVGGTQSTDSPAQAVVLLVLGAALLFAGFVVWVLWFILRVSVLSQVLSEEQTAVAGVFRRSWQLTSGRVAEGPFGLVKVRLTVLITVTGLIVSLVSLVSGIPALVVNAVYGNIFDPFNANPDAVPQALLIPAELVNVAAQSLVAPLYVAFQTAFYLDMRNRREGLDLLRQIEALK